MHCRLLGRPGRIGALQRFLDHVQAHDRVWVCRRIDIARHWKATHPFDAQAFVMSELHMLTLDAAQRAPRRRSRARCSTASTSIRRGSPRPRAGAAAVRAPWRRSSARWSRSCATPARDAQLALIRAHPELAGKAMVAKTLTAESTHEQGKAGLTDCTPEEFATHPAAQRRLQRASSASRSSWRCAGRAARAWPSARSSPPSSAGWTTTRTSSSPRPAQHPPHRRAAPDDKFGYEPDARQPGLGLGRSAGRAQRPGLRGARPAHGHLPHRRAPRLQRAARALDARLRLRRGARSTRSATSSASTTAATAARKRLLTGCHYDTVRNGGKYDGRLGIFVPMACVRELHARRAGACRSASRWSASPKRKASATRRPSSAPAR